MAAEHLDQVLAMERAEFVSPWTAEQFQGEISGHPHAVNQVAAEDATTVRGYLCAWKIGDEFRVHTVTVDPAHRRLGWARFMLETAISSASAEGCTVATLEVRRSNRPARALYQRIGFVEVGRRKAFYPAISKDGQRLQPAEDAILMDCDLRTPPASRL